MALNRDLSFVADSTADHSSPPHSPAPAEDEPPAEQPKRVARTYGRPRAPLPVEASSENVFRTAPKDTRDVVIPASEDVLDREEDDEDDENANDASACTSRPFEWGWKAKLKEMDTMSPGKLTGRVKDQEDVFGGELSTVIGSSTMKPATADEEDPFGGDISTLTASSQSRLLLSQDKPQPLVANRTSPRSVAKSPLPPSSPPASSPVVERNAKRKPKKRVIAESDTESDFVPTAAAEPPAFGDDLDLLGDLNQEVGVDESADMRISSPVSPAPNPIRTPKSRSSPTPPTSGADHEARNAPKGKGKAREGDDEPSHSVLQKPSKLPGTKSTKDKGKGKASVKQLNKKQLKETAAENRRLAAQRNVRIESSAPSRGLHTLSRFVEEFQNNIKSFGADASQELLKSSAEPKVAMPSSPIHEFTSSQHGASSSQPLPRSPKPVMPRLAANPLKDVSAAERALDRADSDSDLEPQGMESFLAERQAKDEKEAQRVKLAELKQRALQQAAVRKAAAQSEDDDDDLVVESGMRSVAKQESVERPKRPRISEGRRRQMQLARTPARRAVMDSSSSPLKASDDLDLLQLVPSRAFAGSERHGRKSKGKDKRPTAAQVNRYLQREAQRQAAEALQKRQDDWVAFGGKLPGTGDGDAAKPDESAIMADIVKALQERKERRAARGDDEDSDEDDDNYEPEQHLERGSCSEDEAEFSGDDERSHSGADEDEEENAPPSVDLDESDVDARAVSNAMDADPTDEEAEALQEQDKENEGSRPRMRALKRNRHLAIQSDDEDENNENASASPGYNRTPKSSRILTPNASYDALDAFAPAPLSPKQPFSPSQRVPPPRTFTKPDISHRSSNSSLASADLALSPTGTERDGESDEIDKENDTSRMFDRSEDKENNAVVRHATSPTAAPLLSRTGSLRSASGSGVGRTASSADGVEEDPSRHPFQELDDPVASPSLSAPRVNNFTARLQSQASRSALGSRHGSFSLDAPPVLNRRGDGFSQSGQEDGVGGVIGGLQPGFGDLFDETTQKPPAKDDFSDDDAENNPRPRFGAFKRPNPSMSDEDVFGPSLSVGGLAPPLEVSQGARRRAEDIFEKEQLYVLEAAAAARRPMKQPELYVNDHGFLTQTRPEGDDVEVYNPDAGGTQLLTQTQPQTQARSPLGTLSLSKEPSLLSQLPSQEPRRRLTKGVRPPTPEVESQTGVESSRTLVDSPPRRNAFTALLEAGKNREGKDKGKEHEKTKRSAFVADQADESDDDKVHGFEDRREDDEENSGSDDDGVVEGLVDDAQMSDAAQAEDLVREKFQEQADAKDAADEKLHMDVIQGKLRQAQQRKRQGFNFGSDDSDGEGMHDSANLRAQRRMHKKRKIGDNDELDALGQRPDTRAFYDTYQKGLQDAEDEFGTLDGGPMSADADMAVADDERDDEEEDGAPQEKISAQEVRRQLQLMARTKQLQETVLDPQDVTWVDRASDEENDAPQIKTRIANRTKGPTLRVDEDEIRSRTTSGSIVISTDVQRKWAREQQRATRDTGTGRASAVTGHRRTSASTASTRPKGGMRSASGGATEAKPVERKESMLQAAVGSRAGKFTE